MKSEERKTFTKITGKKMQIARLHKGMTAAELNAALGDGKESRIKNWESGVASPNFYTFVKVCRILDTSPNLILGFSEETPDIQVSPGEEELLRKLRSLPDKKRKQIISDIGSIYRQDKIERLTKESSE